MTQGSRMGLISPKQCYQLMNAKLDRPIGINTIYQLVKKRSFPSVKIGGRYFVIEDQIDEWLMNQTKNSR